MEKNSKSLISKIFDWFIKIIVYSLILIFTDFLFKKTLYIDNSCFYIWPFLVSILIDLLNRTIKPFLVWLTIPITGMTLGLFYPFINLIILKLASVLLAGHFKIYGIWYAVFASILISCMNVLFDEVIFKSRKRKDDNFESSN